MPFKPAKALYIDSAVLSRLEPEGTAVLGLHDEAHDIPRGEDRCRVQLNGGAGVECPQVDTQGNVNHVDTQRYNQPDLNKVGVTMRMRIEDGEVQWISQYMDREKVFISGSKLQAERNQVLMVLQQDCGSDSDNEVQKGGEGMITSWMCSFMV